MKKMRLFALMLAFVAIVFAGCSMNQNLKLEKSKFSASEFYANTFYNQTSESVNIGNINVSESEKMAFASVITGTTSNEYDLLSIVCAMDFHIELSTDSSNSEKSKFYEFKEEQSNVIVAVEKKSSSAFVVGLYFTNNSVTELENVEPYFQSEVKLIDVSKNINYTLSYKKDDVSNGAEFTYDQSNGFMKIKLDTSIDNITNSITREIYDYAGDVCSIRTISKVKIGGVSSNDSVFEIMKSPFLIRQKVGELNGNKMNSLNNISQDQIAVGSVADKWCYVLVAKASEEGAKLKWQTSFNKYGNMN